jgi:pimeloyl-ACP methyl ester carboxylesterase
MDLCFVFVFKDPDNWQMGSAMSFKLFPIPSIYAAPPCSYKHSRDIAMLSTIDGNMIACKMFSPFVQTVDSFMDFQNRHPTILFSHGNSDDIGTCSSYCQWLADSLSCNVVTYDYVDYGLSDRGDTTECNMCHSIEAVYGYLVASLQAPPRNIFLMGKSLGSVPTVSLSSKQYVEKVAGVILISPIASGARVVMKRTRLPDNVMTMLDDYFAPNIKRAKLIRRPVLIVHGTQDRIVPVQNSHDLFDQLVPGVDYPPLWVQAGHNDIESTHKGLFIQTLVAFMQHCTQQDSTVPYPDTSVE